VVCGHIHEAQGKTDKVGDSKIVSVGMLDKGNVVVIDTQAQDVEHKVIELL
jgi:Icc-related predicted phosphoesterase